MATPPGSIAFKELAENNLTEDGYNELVVAARRALRNPANDGSKSLIGALIDDPEELVSELATSGRLHRLAQHAEDGSHFARALPRAFKDELRDLARKTDAGALAYRIANTLRREQVFVKVSNGANTGKWATAHVDAVNIWNEDENALVNATWGTEIEVVTEWSGDRRTPVCSDEDLVRLLGAVITSADAPLPATEIIRALRHRFQLLFTDPEALGDTLITSAALESVEGEVLERLEATQIIEMLTPEERIIVESGGVNVRELGEKLGCGKSAAAVKRQRLMEFLAQIRTELSDSPSNENERPIGDQS